MYFRYFVIISPWKRAGPCIGTNLNPLHPRMLCAKFGWNWPSGSGEEDENVKSLRQRQRQQRRRTTDKFWSERLTWAFGSGELIKRINRRNIAISVTTTTAIVEKLSSFYISKRTINSNVPRTDKRSCYTCRIQKFTSFQPKTWYEFYNGLRMKCID